MTKLAIIDLDGVVANSDERFKLALRSDGKTDWKIAFKPEHVSLDVLIDGALEAVDNLESKGHAIIFLTSRPESMREATVIWLATHALDSYELVMKPASKQFTKTVKWKAEEVQRMASLPGIEKVVFVDDEERNREAIEALGLGIVCAVDLKDYVPDDGPIII